MVGKVKLLVNALLAMLCIATGVFAYWASSNELPSYYIAGWVMTKDIYPGGPITVRFILFRQRICIKRIEQIIEQGTNSSFPIIPPESIEAQKLGLDILTVERTMPIEVHPGTAIYVANFIWRCDVGFGVVRWQKTLTLRVEMPITISGG